MKHARTLVGFLLSGLLLWWTLRGVEAGSVWRVLRSADSGFFALSAVFATLVVPIRARKWRPILEPAAGTVAFGPLWRSTAIGVMTNNVFPLRAGEFARAFALTREVPRVAMTTALGSLAVDRLLDALVVFLLMFAAMLDPRFPDGALVAGRPLRDVAAGGVAVIGCALLACYAVVLRPAWVTGIVGAVCARVLPAQRDTLVGFAELAVGSLAVLRDTRRFAAVFGWTLVHWLTHALALHLGFLALGIEAPVTAALFLQGVIAIGVAVPSSPGFFGVFEAAASVGLEVYGVPRDLAFSWGLGFHLLSFVPITILGAIYFARVGLSVRDVTGSGRGADATES